MTGRVLIVDDILANTKLLEARLLAEYYNVQCVDNGFDAIKIVEAGECDIVLLDVMMPEITGFDVCRYLKGKAETMHVPIVLVTALDGLNDRIQGLEAGADDFLTKPVREMELLARVKSLLRVKLLVDELRARAKTAHDVHLETMFERVFAKPASEEKVLIIDDRESQSNRMRKTLERTGYSVKIETDPQAGLIYAAEEQPILCIVSLDLEGVDGLRICSQIRQLERTRNMPLLAIADQGAESKLSRALELGVSDFITRPVEPNELAARCMTQLRRRRYADFLKESVQNTMEMAVKDALTGLYNRRYMETHMAGHVKAAAEKKLPLSILILDIDHFKNVNDTYGHDGGDEILKEFAKRIEDNVRRIDLPCRMGGEEFVVIMPETDQALALSVAERIREVVAMKPFHIADQGRDAEITTSIGIGCYFDDRDTPETILKRADLALYEAKEGGRNKVIYKQAA